MNKYLLEAQSISKSFNEGALQVQVLDEIDLQIEPCQSLAIIGASGSGKSTLLHLLGGLEPPDSGTVSINGVKISGLSEQARGQARNQQIGFIYQFHHLLAEFTALENVAMPLLIRRLERKQALTMASALLDKVGLSKRLEHKPGELSGGERQRAAIARALVTKPACILADEPTGNLDEKTADQVFALMLELKQEFNLSLIMVTHNLALSKRLDAVLELKEGKLYQQS